MPQPRRPIKLLAIDIDGTLLNREKKITKRTRAAIQEAQANGILVMLATARRYRNAAPFAEELGLEMPLIICDGAQIVHFPDRTIIKQHLLDVEVAQVAVETMVQHAIQPIVHHTIEQTEVTWCGPDEFDNPELAPYLEIHTNVTRFSYDSLFAGNPGPLRIVAFTSKETSIAIIPHIAKLDCSCYTIERGLYGCAEVTVMHRHSSKATALLTMAETLNIEMDEVMAVGDGINDREMLQIAGWGVAMGQASQIVKEAADTITESNGEDGAAHAIERYALR
jgi:Cof subfamily protein (haloacid dehalogenase superfamily)